MEAAYKMQMRLNTFGASFFAASLLAVNLVAQTRHLPGTSSRLDADLALDRWLTGNYDKVLDRVLPSGFVQNGSSGYVEWIVSARIVPQFHSQWEFQFTFRKLRDNKTELSFAVPMGSSVKAQLIDLRKKHPNASAESLSKEIAVGKRTLSGSEHGELQRLAADFEGIRFSPVLPEGLPLDTPFYYFWLQSFSLNRVEARLDGYGPDSSEQPHPLVEWAEHVRKFCMDYVAR